MLPTLKDTILEYRAAHKALPAFNIDTFEIYQAVEAAVAETRLPCLVQLSAGEDKFIEAERLFLLVQKARLQGLPIFLNMDHCKDADRLKTLAKLGFDMLHFDGSGLDYQTNLGVSQHLIPDLKSINPHLLVEAEFNHISPVDGGVDPTSFTNPLQAQEFVNITHADFLAVSIGNMHGVNQKLPESINLDLLQQIATALPDTYLTLHGGSGIPLDQVKSAILSGIVKININTDLRLQFKKSLADSLSRQSTEKIYDYFEPVIHDLKNLVIQKLNNFSNV